MALRELASLEVMRKKVLVRVDFNVELRDVAHIQEGYKLEVAKKTIDTLFQSGAKQIALLTHFGRPKKPFDPAFSTAQIESEVARVLEREVKFVPACIGDEVVTALETLPSQAVLLLENVRFYPGEEANDPVFAKALAAPFDCYVNEAFGVSHRAHASVTTVPTLLPSAAGLYLFEELLRLDALKTSPDRPAVAIIGGAKIETKLPLIQAFQEIYDCVLVGGKIANEAIDQGLTFNEKVLLPRDFDSPQRLDIGPMTAAYFAQIIKKAKTIVWNGPMGKFEEKPYDIGTNLVLAAILESEANVVIGGGESLAVLEQAGVFHKIGFVSSGGGAMLEYLSGKTLPGIEVLRATV
ncbi:MAG: phosphoglycerate kinase [Candidatus Moraniibacteriota bacterium]|nr:MAG: phosphoglycerate kinase [Candidatus Moranbacteria bacterium]